jgi:hypothetical protein
LYQNSAVRACALWEYFFFAENAKSRLIFGHVLFVCLWEKMARPGLRPLGTIQRVPRLEVYPNHQECAGTPLPQDFGRATRTHPGNQLIRPIFFVINKKKWPRHIVGKLIYLRRLGQSLLKKSLIIILKPVHNFAVSVSVPGLIGLNL